MHRILYTLISVLTVTLLCFSTVHAAAPPKPGKPGSSISLSATLGGLLFSASETEGHRSLTPIYGIKLSYDKLGTGITNSIGVEGTFNYFSSEIKESSQDVSGYLLRTDAIYSFSMSKTFVPFLVAGGGGMFIQREDGLGKDPLLNYGFGFKYFLEDYLAVRMEARQLFLYSDVSTRNNFELTAGLTYVFGKERKKPVPPSEKKDELPQFKMKQVVEPTGATPAKLDPALEYSFMEQLGAVGPAIVGITSVPSGYQPSPGPMLPTPEQRPEALAFKTPPAPRAAPPREIPHAVAPAPVAPPAPPAVAAPARPVPVAPAPAAPAAPVEPAAPAVLPELPPELPIPVPKARVMVRTKLHEFIIEFDFGKHDIRPEYNARLKHAAELIMKAVNPVVTIEGHTDIVGKHGANQALSIRRASSVKAELVKYGVDQRRVIIRGHSFDRPVATNTTDTGRQRNRRATTVVTAILEELTGPVQQEENAQQPEPEPAEQLVTPPAKQPVGKPALQQDKQPVKQPVQTQAKQPAKKQAKPPAPQQAKQPGKKPAKP